MPWQCPGCDTAIRHSDDEPTPRRDARYRCHICRLELTVDLRTNRLRIIPLDDANRPSHRRGAALDRRSTPRGGRRATDIKEPKWFRAKR